MQSCTIASTFPVLPKEEGKENDTLVGQTGCARRPIKVTSRREWRKELTGNFEGILSIEHKKGFDEERPDHGRRPRRIRKREARRCGTWGMQKKKKKKKSVKQKAKFE